MMLGSKWLLALVMFLLSPPQEFCQRVESVKGPDSENSCNVVNVHFGADQQQTSSGRPVVGAPGKRGPMGPIGHVGNKGNQGERGPKGDRGESTSVEQLKRNIANMLGVASCQELMENHGVMESGYYIMKANPLDHESPVYRYCDFGSYSGISSCTELVARYNVTRHGYYRLRDGSGKFSFHYCPDPHTCHQLSQRDGIRDSGLYQLGPPGDQFEVYCNFFSGQATTEIWHDSMEEIKASSTCGNQGCFTRTPVYKVSHPNMVKIAENSGECRQYIKMRCYASVLYWNGNDPFTWWVSRQGEKMLYWGGAVSERPYFCACGETGTCTSHALTCNCNSNAGVMAQDEGYLTDKSKLPVREMKFGDLNDAGEQAWHTLGRLECTGQA